jgi:hypothetical protein
MHIPEPAGLVPCAIPNRIRRGGSTRVGTVPFAHGQTKTSYCPAAQARPSPLGSSPAGLRWTSDPAPGRQGGDVGGSPRCLGLARAGIGDFLLASTEPRERPRYPELPGQPIRPQAAIVISSRFCSGFSSSRLCSVHCVTRAPSSAVTHLPVSIVHTSFLRQRRAGCSARTRSYVCASNRVACVRSSASRPGDDDPAAPSRSRGLRSVCTSTTLRTGRSGQIRCAHGYLLRLGGRGTCPIRRTTESAAR